MTNPVPLTEIWRGPFLESLHLGHAVVCDDTGEIVESWGDPDAVVMPRSSYKMMQALPLIESGAAAAHGLNDRQLALACSSHSGGMIHAELAAEWLGQLGLGDDDLRCGPQDPRDADEHARLIREGQPICQVHNNCSGKHAGFLTLGRHLKAGPDYIDPDHPVQKACLDAFETVTGRNSAGFGIDGCSAPSHATTMHAMARAMAYFAAAQDGADLRQSAAVRLRTAMATYPELVAGDERACTRLMRAMDHKVVIKTGAEGYYIAIIPEKKLGVALKIADGATRGAECAIAAILARYGVLDPAHPLATPILNGPIMNRAGIHVGAMKPAAALV